MASELVTSQLKEEQNPSLRYKLSTSIGFDRVDGNQDYLSQIACANAAGLFFVVQRTTVNVFRLSDLGKLQSTNLQFKGDSVVTTDSGSVSVSAISSIRLSHNVLQVAVNSDDTLLSVAYTAGTDVFVDIIQIGTFNRVSRIRLAESRLVDVVWNPAVPNFLATLFSEVKQPSSQQFVRFWELDVSKNSVKLVGSVNAVTSVGFSPKGKLIVIGMQDGRLRQLDLSCSLKREVQFPLAASGPSSMVYVQWLTNFTFLVVYRNQASSEDSVCGLTIDKQGDRVKLTRFETACPPDPDCSNSRARYLVAHIREWRIVLIGSSTSHSITTFCYSSPEGNELDSVNWTEYTQADDARPDLPMTADYVDTQPLGTVLVTDASTSTASVYVFSNMGVLLRFSVLNSDTRCAPLIANATAMPLNIGNLPKLVDLSVNASPSGNPSQAPQATTTRPQPQAQPQVQPAAATNSIFGNLAFAASSNQSTNLNLSAASQPKVASESNKTPQAPAASIFGAQAKPTAAPDFASKPAALPQQQSQQPQPAGATKLPGSFSFGANQNAENSQLLRSTKPSINQPDLERSQSLRVSSSTNNRPSEVQSKAQLQSLVFNDCVEAVEFDGELRQVTARVRQLMKPGESDTRAKSHREELLKADDQVAKFVRDAKANIEALSSRTRIAKRDWLNLLVALDHVNALASLLDSGEPKIEGSRLMKDAGAMRLMASFRDGWLEQRARRLEAVSIELTEAENLIAELNARIDAESAVRFAAQRRAKATASQSSVRDQLARICSLNRVALATSRSKIDSLVRKCRRLESSASGKSAVDANRNSQLKLATVAEKDPKNCQQKLPSSVVNFLRTREIPIVRCSNSDALCSLRVDQQGATTNGKAEPQKTPVQKPAQASVPAANKKSEEYDADHIAALTKSLINQLGEFKSLQSQAEPPNVSANPTDDPLIRILNGAQMSNLRPVRVTTPASESPQAVRSAQPNSQAQAQAKPASSPMQAKVSLPTAPSLRAQTPQSSPLALTKPNQGQPDETQPQSLASGPGVKANLGFASATTAAPTSSPLFGTANANAPSRMGATVAAVSPLAGPKADAASAPGSKASPTPVAAPAAPTSATTAASSALFGTPLAAGASSNAAASTGNTFATPSGPAANAGAFNFQRATTAPSGTIAPNGSTLFASLLGSSSGPGPTPQLQQPANATAATTASVSTASAGSTPQSSVAGTTSVPSNVQQAPPVSGSASSQQLFGGVALSSAGSTLNFGSANNTSVSTSASSSTAMQPTASLFGTASQSSGNAAAQPQQSDQAASKDNSNSNPISGFGSLFSDASKPNSLFGASASSASNGGSLFGGAANKPQQPAASNVFGAVSSTAAPTTQTQPQQQAAAKPISASASGFSFAANSGFAKTAQQSATSPGAGTGQSLFGAASNASSNSNAGTSLFGGGQSNTSTVFGGASANKPNTGTGTSLFGGSASSGGTSLFGGAATSTSQPGTAGTGTSLFGAATSTGQSGTAGTGTSLFGGAATSTSQPGTTGSGTSLFGGASAAPSGGSLFGGAAKTQTPGTGTSLFGGASSSAGTGTGTSLFGSAMNQNQQGAAQPSLFGAAAASAQQAKPVFGQSSFGAAPAFGSPSGFGSASASTPAFGAGVAAGAGAAASNAPSTFSSLFGAAQQPAAASNQQSSFGFAALAGASAPSFSNLAGGTASPAFGGAPQQSATSPSFTMRRM